MSKKFKCPVMCGMNMMYEPEPMGIQYNMPMAENMEMDSFYADEEDERHFMKMYPESCMRIMVYVKAEIDIMEEEKNEMLLEDRPDRKMIDVMTDRAYKKLIRENPEMEEKEETRQYPARQFSRDLLRILLLNELLRRRRRRRRGYYGYPPYGYGYNYGYDYYDYD